jgi:hypothetical protein
VGDEDVGEAPLGLQSQQDRDDAGLDADVEGGGGLVEHDDIGLQHQRPGGGDPLALPARERRGPAGQQVLARVDRRERRAHPLRALAAVADPEPVERLAHQALDPSRGVERGERVLVDELEVAADAAQRVGRPAVQLLAGDHDPAPYLGPPVEPR